MSHREIQFNMSILTTRQRIKQEIDVAGRSLRGGNMRKMPEFSLFFFNADSAERQDRKYQMLFEAAKFADEPRFAAVWTPERHFQRFGGLYGSPSVTGAALAVVTRQLSIRAGSVLFPLQNPLRVAEACAMMASPSIGRVGVAA